MIWACSSDGRILPNSAPRRARHIMLAGAQGQVISFQVGVLLKTFASKLDVTLSGSMMRYASARLAELVPLMHQTRNTPFGMIESQAPAYVPDPLPPLRSQPMDIRVSRSVWVSVRLPRRSMRGDVVLGVKLNGQLAGEVQAEIRTWDFELPPLELPVTNWFYSDAICDWYKVEPFSGRYWKLLEKYFANLVDHNQTAIYTPLFTPPLDADKRLLQLVEVTELAKGRYRFGWRKLKRWLDLALGAGFKYFEMSHLFSQWGAAHAIRVVVNRSESQALLFRPDAPATGTVYKRFLQQFLPALVKFLKGENVFERCVFHLSDEPGQQHLEQYRAVREMVRSTVPEIRITEALSHVEFLKEQLIDQPVPVIDKLPDFLGAGVKPWTYTCCNPQGTYPNRFLDYPLYRLRVLGAMLYLWELKGFLHWGCNYWYRGGTRQLIDPFLVTDAHRWPDWFAGDPFIIYPGEDGPMDSIRWEVFRAAMDDYRLLKLADEKVGRDRVAGLLDAIRSPAQYPRSSDYLAGIGRVAASLVSPKVT